MWVVNISEFTFGFKLEDVQYNIPFNGKSYEVPDNTPKFRELKIVDAPNQIKINNNIVSVDRTIFNNYDFFDKLDNKNTITNNAISAFENKVMPIKNEEVEIQDKQIKEKHVPQKRKFSKIKAAQKKRLLNGNNNKD